MKISRSKGMIAIVVNKLIFFMKQKEKIHIFMATGLCSYNRFKTNIYSSREKGERSMAGIFRRVCQCESSFATAVSWIMECPAAFVFIVALVKTAT